MKHGLKFEFHLCEQNSIWSSRVTKFRYLG